jgi:hypothetical protein
MSDLEGTLGLVAMHSDDVPRYGAMARTGALVVALVKFRASYRTFARSARDLRWDIRTGGGVASCVEALDITTAPAITVLEALVRARRLMNVCRLVVSQSKDHSMKRSRPLVQLSGAFNALNHAAIGVKTAYGRQEALKLLGGD